MLGLLATLTVSPAMANIEAGPWFGCVPSSSSATVGEVESVVVLMVGRADLVSLSETLILFEDGQPLRAERKETVGSTSVILELQPAGGFRDDGVYTMDFNMTMSSEISREPEWMRLARLGYLNVCPLKLRIEPDGMGSGSARGVSLKSALHSVCGDPVVAETVDDCRPGIDESGCVSMMLMDPVLGPSHGWMTGMPADVLPEIAAPALVRSWGPNGGRGPTVAMLCGPTGWSPMWMDIKFLRMMVVVAMPALVALILGSIVLRRRIVRQ